MTTQEFDNEDEDEECLEFQTFKHRCWALERKAKRVGGFLKVAPSHPTHLKAYAARMVRKLSTLGWDIPDLMPPENHVCAFNIEQWNSKVPLWDLWSTIVAAKGRLTVIVVTGESLFAVGQTFVANPVTVLTLGD